MREILIIEDEEELAQFILLELEYEGFSVTVSHSGREGLKLALDSDWDLILLDIMLPDLNGIEVCRRIRAVKETPIIMVTARGSVLDRVSGLDNGADDYILKPFAIEELLARMRVIFRRIDKEKQFQSHLTFKDLQVDILGRVVKRGDEEVELTKKEYDLLITFIQNINRVLTREVLLEKVWGYDTTVETNIVDVYVGHLRNKIDSSNGETYIQTIRGMGYVMR
ncbi:DNA-binding response OmpR family regulator [Aneurinibacillus soli]|uniref:Response regulator ArlR n=1 Tax=Aneurinibacillus soli TaxID=1500254 RepID=A0A0U5AQ77_9BACL|nr:response regulator transcription factor [Aneurinibacillus soli]PYE57171.1 DNA-binding response OmpR family regulator [Aneurinibacillus soli]BAU25973.1 Response regulator ArlR [Aneurinibacillus soli]